MFNRFICFPFSGISTIRARNFNLMLTVTKQGHLLTRLEPCRKIRGKSLRLGDGLCLLATPVIAKPQGQHPTQVP